MPDLRPTFAIFGIATLMTILVVAGGPIYRLLRDPTFDVFGYWLLIGTVAAGILLLLVVSFGVVLLLYARKDRALRRHHLVGRDPINTRPDDFE